MTPRTLRAWRRTEYRIECRAGTAVARIGRRSAAVDAALARLGVRQGAFVTAWNPLGRRRPEGWNRRAMRGFAEAVRRLPQLAGQGRFRNWREDHLLLGTDPRRAARLARRFRQLGLVLVRRGQPARLAVLGP